MSITRTWVIAALTLVLAVVACTTPSGGESASTNAPEVTLNTNLETVYYRVQGLTTREIFESVKAVGPELDDLEDGKFASGLTGDQSSFKWEFLEFSGHCDLDIVEISVNLVVTLPEHAEPEALSAEQAARWGAFARGVAIHEQHHVDIHLNRMASFKSMIETFSRRFSDCDALGARIELAWDAERALDEEQQEEFHRSEEQRTALNTRAMRQRVDMIGAEMSRIQAELDASAQKSRQLRADIAILEAQADPLMHAMEDIQRRHPLLNLPPREFEEFQNLLDEWNILNDQRNVLVNEINEHVTLRNEYLETINRLVEETNLQLEEIAWIS
jgi:predicted secreted Zn-dependent protease